MYIGKRHGTYSDDELHSFKRNDNSVDEFVMGLEKIEIKTDQSQIFVRDMEEVFH